MTKIDLVMNHDDQVATVADKLKSDFSQSLAGVFGSPTPRIHTPLNDLPSRGLCMNENAHLSLNTQPVANQPGRTIFHPLGSGVFQSRVMCFK